MKFFVIADTHFGHTKIHEYCGRPAGFEDKILGNISRLGRTYDTLIHLGDVCFGRDAHWHMMLKIAWSGKKWLIRGNHDHKSNQWYMQNGWDFVGEMATLNMFGKNILFSHKPFQDIGYDINIHGHYHNSEIRKQELELRKINNSKQKLVMIEHEYCPYNLEDLCK